MTSKHTSQSIFVAEEDGLPVIIGECPSCKRGARSLVLVDYIPKIDNKMSSVYLRCICCKSIHLRRIKDITEE